MLGLPAQRGSEYPANRQILSAGWHTYFGLHIPPENILCDGCRSEGQAQIDRACPVRPCVIERSLHNCSECPDYACVRLAERLVVYEEVVARLPQGILAGDRERFIAPYEDRRRLEALRAPKG